MASWFTRLSRQPPAQQLGPPWAVPEAQLFDDDEDPAARLLRRRVRWEVVDESRNARSTGQEAFLSLEVLRLSSDSGIGARIPLTAIHREEYMQPIFGANYLTGLAMQDGVTVRWTLEFLSAGAAQFASVFFRAVRAARSGTTNAAAIQASARVASAAEAETCVWAEAVPVDGAPSADLPTATAL